MGPIALYDKSFLQGLSVDEAVLFDHFFYPVTCPIFYVETLADLEKEPKGGRTPEQIVGSLAFKAPEMHGGPAWHHLRLVEADLSGRSVPLTGRIPLANAIPVRDGDRRGVVVRETKESKAFNRWQSGHFLELERDFARGWRQELDVTDLELVARRAHQYGLDLGSLKSVEDVKNASEQVINQLTPRLQLALVFENLSIRAELREPIEGRVRHAGEPDLASFAPYARFVLLLRVFFEVALATGKISTQRASNINDLAYLLYLPFCMIFVSSDKLHRECAPHFLRPDQQFVWGLNLKSALAQANSDLLKLPEDARNNGLIKLSPPPPPGLIAEIYKTAFPGKQVRTERANSKPQPKSDDAGLAERIERIRTAEPMSAHEVDFDPSEADSLTIERRISKKRGSWFQVPHDLKPDA